MKDSPKFTETTKRISAKMAGERCSICETLTSLPNKDRTGFINKGEGAHIYGANRATNNRFNKEITHLELKHLSNCIWLCSNCHKHVDSDESHFTAQTLTKIKEQHFQRVVNGKYGESTFKKIDDLNFQIDLLTNQINDKQKVIEQSERIFDLELNKIVNEKVNLENEKKELLVNYSSIIQSTKLINAQHADHIYELIFQQNDLDGALKLLDESDLKKQEYDIAKNRVIKGEIYLIKKDYKNAYSNYQKAFDINQSFEIASFFIRFLTSIKENGQLIEVIEKTIIEESSSIDRPSIILTLKACLGQVYSKINPEKSIILFKECIEINEDKLRNTEKYLLNKAGYTNYLAISYKEQGELDEALRQCEISLGVFLTGQVEGDSLEECFSEFCSLYNTIAQIYELSSNNEEALKYYSLALKLSKEQLPNNLNLKISTILNMCNCTSKINFGDLLDLLNDAIKDIINLLQEKPLSYFEILISAYCKKSDLFLFNGQNDKSGIELANAEKVLNQALLINEIGFQIVKAEFLNRKAMFYMIDGKKEEAFKLISSSIEIYKSSKNTSRELQSKIATLLLFKSKLHNIKEQKIKDLSTAIDSLKSVANKHSSDILLLKRIELELMNVS